MAIYLKYQTASGPIKGPVTTDGFKDWIELDSFSFGSGRALGTARAGSASRQANEPSLSEITCSKGWDWQSSAKLFEESVKGKLDNKVEILCDGHAFQLPIDDIDHAKLVPDWDAVMHGKSGAGNANQPKPIKPGHRPSQKHQKQKH